MNKSVLWTLDFYPELGRSLADVYSAAQQHAQLAEELGFKGMWLAEHHFHNIGSIPNPAVLLSSLASCTEKIRLGPAIAVLPLRDMTLIAEDYAMLDILSDGRLNMGVGIGNSRGECEKMGGDFDTRRDDFDKRIGELKDKWVAPFDTSLETLNVRPVQTPMPPIYVSTNSPETAFKAGKNGDSVLTIVLPFATNLSGLERVIEAHARGLSESDSSSSNAELVVAAYAYGSESKEEALQTTSDCFGRFLKAATGEAVPDPRGFCEKMISHNAGFVGTTEQITIQLDRFRDMGVKHIAFLANFGGMSPEQVANSIKCLAKT